MLVKLACLALLSVDTISNRYHTKLVANRYGYQSRFS